MMLSSVKQDTVGRVGMRSLPLLIKLKNQIVTESDQEKIFERLNFRS